MDESEWRRFVALDQALRIGLVADLMLLLAGLFLFMQAIGGTWAYVVVLILLCLFPTLLAQALAAGAWARRESRSMSLLHRDNRIPLCLGVGGLCTVGGVACATLGASPGPLDNVLPLVGLPVLFFGIGLIMWGRARLRSERNAPRGSGEPT